MVLKKSASKRVVILKESDIIPGNEVWLHENKAAVSSLMRGIEQAKQKKFASDPLVSKPGTRKNKR